MRMTEQLIKEARAWVGDCVRGDLALEEVEELSAEAVFRGVERHYVGGWDQFASDHA